MDFEALMSTAASFVDQEGRVGYSTKLPPVKKLEKAKVNASAVAAILNKKTHLEQKKAEFDKKRLAENKVKEKKKKSGFSLKDLEEAKEKQKRKLTKNQPTSDDAKLNVKSKKQSQEMCTNSDNSKPAREEKKSEKSEDIKSVTKVRKKRPPPPPSVDYASVIGMAKKNLNEKGGNVSIQDLLKAKEGKKRERPMTQRELEEEERRKKRELEEKLGIKPSYLKKDGKVSKGENSKSGSTKEEKVKSATKATVEKRDSDSKPPSRGEKETNKVTNAKPLEKAEEKNLQMNDSKNNTKTPILKKEPVRSTPTNQPKKPHVPPTPPAKKPSPHEKIREKKVFKNERRYYEEESEEEYDDEMDDFIDDGDDGGYGGLSRGLSDQIWSILGKGKKRYRFDDTDDDDDGGCMEASYGDIMREEARSAKLGKLEDDEEERREAAKQKQKMEKKKKKKRRMR